MMVTSRGGVGGEVDNGDGDGEGDREGDGVGGDGVGDGAGGVDGNINSVHVSRRGSITVTHGGTNMMGEVGEVGNGVVDVVGGVFGGEYERDRHRPGGLPLDRVRNESLKNGRGAGGRGGSLDSPTVRRQASATERLEHEWAEMKKVAKVVAKAVSPIEMAKQQRQQMVRVGGESGGHASLSPPLASLLDPGAMGVSLPGGGGGEFGSKALLMRRFHKLAGEMGLNLPPGAGDPRDQGGEVVWRP